MTTPMGSPAAAIDQAMGPIPSATVAAGTSPDWRTINWGSHERSVLIDERRVNLVELGRGPPIVFIHGLSGCWQNWLENIPAAASKHRVLAPDLPGFGASEMPRQESSIPGYARIVASLCNALGVARATLVGNSMGGFIAAELAIGAPGLVGSLVLVDAAGLSTQELYYRPRYMLARVARSAGVSHLARVPAVAKRPRLRELTLGLIARHPERLSADLSRAILAGAGREGFPEALTMMSRYSIRDRLQEISCPTLIVWGEKDRLVPLSDAFELQSSIAGSRLVVFPDAGHVPMLEFPERFNAILANFTSPE